MLIRLPSVQTWVTQKLASYLSKQLNTKVSIKGVDIEFIKNIVLEDLYIEDQHSDTLLFVKELKVNIGPIIIDKSKFSINSVSLIKPKFHLKVYKNEKVSNLQFILDFFASPKTIDTTRPQPLNLKVKSLKIFDGDFLFEDQNIAIDNFKTINFDDTHVSQLNIDLKNFSFYEGEIRADINKLALQEKSGFIIENLSTRFKMTPTEMECNNLNLITPYSHIKDYYLMRYDSISEMGNYIEKVKMNANFKNSKISFRDISYFSSTLVNFTEKFLVDGSVFGTVSDLSSNQLKIKTSNNTHVEGVFKVKGLPNIDQTVFILKIDKFNSSIVDAKTFLSQIDQKDVAESIPEDLNKLGEIKYAGYFKGTLTDFSSKGQLQTAIGGLIADLKMSFPKTSAPIYVGSIETIDLDIGEIANNKIFGATNLVAKIDGKGFKLDELNTKLITSISDIRINGYQYTNITADGIFNKKQFNGVVKIDEDNIKLDFDGSVDYNDKRNPEFNFHANIEHADLRKLKLIEDSLIVSSTISVNFIGTNLENLIGKLSFTNSEVSKGKEKYQFKNISLDSKFDGDGKQLSLESDIINANIQGDYHLANITSACKSFLRNFLPSLNYGTISKFENQDFNFAIDIVDAEPITNIFLPKLKIAKSAHFLGSLNTEKELLRITGALDYIKYENYEAKDLVIDGENNSKVFDLNIASNRILINDSININNIAISNSIKNDSIQFNIKLADKSSINQLDLNGIVSFKTDSIKFGVLPSELLIDNQEWKILQAFNIIYSADKKITINNFSLENKEQSLVVEGIISKDVNDELKIDAHNLELNSFNQILKKYKVNITGRLNATTKISGILDEFKLVSDLIIDDLVYNNDSIGTLRFNSTLDQRTKLITLAGNIINKTLKTLEIAGTINTEKKTNNLNIDVLMNETELVVIEPFVKNYISKIKGVASADLKVRGSLDAPTVDGYLNLKNVGVNINYLNTYFTLSDQIKFTENKILLDNIQIKDVDGNKGTITGNVSHKNFSEFRLDLKVQARNLLCLNTTAKENELYYGKAYTSGMFFFKGPVNDLRIDINATTEPGTKFFIPISDENSAAQQNYIQFISADSTENKNNYKIDLSGITLNMNLQVNDDAEVQLIMDQTTGEAIKGRGNANLRLVINTLGNFEMFGNYEITDGEYNFTLQSLINKKFKVEKGGRIRWNGDPVKAKVDISAIYELRPAIYPLIYSATNDTSYSTTDKVLTQCILYMQNDLLSPDISFGLRFPNDQDISSKVSGYLANADNMNNQVGSLLVFGRFANTSNNSYLPTTGFIAAQLSNLVSTKNFDLNLDNGVGGSIRLFNDRITIDGTVTNQSNSTNVNQANANSSALTGDVSIEYKISKDGRFRAKAFQRNDNNSDILKRGNSQNEQGVGIFYRIEFDTFRELVDKLFKKKAKAKK